MNPTTQTILDYNAGRSPERLQLKLMAMRKDAFAFFRGSAPLFYQSLNLSKSLLRSPSVLACGDLHLENFGSYKGDNRLVYFDINDFDEACVAPLAFELIRFVSSIFVATQNFKTGFKADFKKSSGKNLPISENDARDLAALFLDTYAATIQSTKPRWVERATATGAIKTLLQSVKNHHRPALIAQRTVQKNKKTVLLIDGVRTLIASADDRKRATAILAAYAKTGLATHKNPGHFEPIDIANRIAGNGSLGLERYVALVRGDGTSEGRYLVDIKIAKPSALSGLLANHLPRQFIQQPTWNSEALRIVSAQRVAQAISPALLGAVSDANFGEPSYVIKELQPTADRLNLAALSGKNRTLSEVIRTMAEVTAWAHLRGTARFGAASVDQLVAFAMEADWKVELQQAAIISAGQTQQQWHDFAADVANEKLVGLLMPTQPNVRGQKIAAKVTNKVPKPMSKNVAKKNRKK